MISECSYFRIDRETMEFQEKSIGLAKDFISNKKGREMPSGE